MPRKNRIQPGEKIGLKLTTADRKLLLEGLTCLPSNYERLLQKSAPEPILLTLDQLEDLGGYIAAEANRTADKKAQKKLDMIFQKIQRLLETHTDEEPPKTVKIEDGRRDKLVADQVARIAEWAGAALVAAEQLGIKGKTVEQFDLQPVERAVVAVLPSVPPKLKKKVEKKDAEFTVAEVATMILALADAILDAEPLQQVTLLLVAQSLMTCLKERIVGPEQAPRSKKPKSTHRLLLFKITLKGSKPSIWRRIQVANCTLDQLHEHIQTAMGWTNSHLHQFGIGKQLYGDPLLMEEDFEEMNYRDSTSTMVSDILPKAGKRFRFEYEYDFGDSWHHEILFEGEVQPEAGKKYPLCVEGERACPPEDVGGMGGYQQFVEAVADPDHEEHEEFLGWIGGKFDPEAFDAKKATARMKKGLPDWRDRRRHDRRACTSWPFFDE